MFFSRILRKVFENNTDILKNFLELILQLKIINLNILQKYFGSQYSAPFICVSLEEENGSTNYIALQDVFEPVMRKETIVYFLAEASENLEYDFTKYTLINFNLFDRAKYKNDLLVHSEILGKKIIDINLVLSTESNTLLEAFLALLNDIENPSFLTSNFSEIVKLKIEYEKELYKVDKYRILDLEMGVYDRVSLMKDDVAKNTLLIRAVQLYLKYNFIQENIFEIFEELDKDTLQCVLDRCKINYDIAIKLFESGKTVKEVEDILQEHHSVIYLAKEKVEKHNQL